MAQNTNAAARDAASVRTLCAVLIRVVCLTMWMARFLASATAFVVSILSSLSPAKNERMTSNAYLRNDLLFWIGSKSHTQKLGSYLSSRLVRKFPIF
jgi:hypothetical protein